MPQNVTQYDLLISCPGDIKEEIEVINRTVQKFNDQFSDTLGISIRTRHWSKNSYPQSGGKPQALLNEQFVKKCDAPVSLSLMGQCAFDNTKDNYIGMLGMHGTKTAALAFRSDICADRNCWMRHKAEG